MMLLHSFYKKWFKNLYTIRVMSTFFFREKVPRTHRKKWIENAKVPLYCESVAKQPNYMPKLREKIQTAQARYI
jgi:hypothetical protein